MLPEHMRSPDPTVGGNSITENGALCISSGSKAGRVPKQKRIVEDDITRDVSALFSFSFQQTERSVLGTIQPISCGKKSEQARDLLAHVAVLFLVCEIFFLDIFK